MPVETVIYTNVSPAGLPDGTKQALWDLDGANLYAPATVITKADGTEINLTALLADIATLVNTGIDVISRPAIAAATDAVGAVPATGAVMQGLTARTPVSVVINAASGDNSIVAAQGAGNIIRVLSYTIVAGGTGTARFESAAGGTALTGIMPFVANTGVSVPFSSAGHFQTAANAALSLEATADFDGHLTYIVVT